MEKTNDYILLGWPDSQPFLYERRCIPAGGDEPAVFVPRDLYLKSKGVSPADDLLDRADKVRSELLSFIGKNVPEKGITLTKAERETGDCRVDITEHFTGEVTRMDVVKIFPGRLEGVDDYGNEIERCSLQQDCGTDALYDIARFLVLYRGKKRV